MLVIVHSILIPVLHSAPYIRILISQAGHWLGDECQARSARRPPGVADGGGAPPLAARSDPLHRSRALYTSVAYQHLLTQHGVRASMSRKGNCYDNAVVESFFSTLKNELVHERDYHSREEAQAEIFEFIEVFYNRQRLHQTLGYVSPVQFEAAHVP